MSEPILDLETAVRELGALPMPVGSEPRTLSAERLAEIGDRRDEAVEVSALASWPLGEYRLIQQTLKDQGALLTNNERLRSRITELEADREASDREYEQATARLAALETERRTTNEALSAAAEQLRRDRDRIAELENRNGSALPWAHTMPDDDLHLFLDDLVAAAMNRWRTEADGSGVPDRTTLALIEAACAKWRTPGQGYRSDEPDTYPPALPWARLMDHEDLTDFLDELAASAITHASAETALAEVEKTCGTWRLIAEAQHAHNTAPGPDAETGGAS